MPIQHDEAMRLQRTELQRSLALLKSLDAEDWTKQTDCPDWDVRRMYLHVLGACEAGARMLENTMQMAKAVRARRRHGGPLEAAISGVQVRDREHLAPAELVERFEAIIPKVVKGRGRLPAVLRSKAKIPVDGPVVEKWTLGYLVDTIYLRDLWMHRVDAARATDKPLELTAEHDGRIVADVVEEWAARHGQPYTLVLAGPAGGRWERGTSGERIELDAVEFCRTLAGRTETGGLMTTVVPF